MRKTRLPYYLAIFGTLPFVALSIAISTHQFHDAKMMIEFLLTYAAIIISFLGGIHWGISLHHYNYSYRIANLLTLESVAPSLVAWGILFYPGVHVQLLVLTLLYALMWSVDSLLYNRDLIPQWFFELRSIVTPIVVVSLYVAYFGLV
jgi:hypothetical protein